MSTLAERKENVPPNLAFIVLTAISLILWFHALRQTFSDAIQNDEYTHILLILPISALLIFQSWSERKRSGEIGSTTHAHRQWLPAAVLLPACLILLALVSGAKWSEESGTGLALKMALLIGWWIASFLFCFGVPAFRLNRFALLFLFWMVPLPVPVVDRIVRVLQVGSAITTNWLFEIFRVPVIRDGTTLQIPGLEVRVEAECSSIRTSLILFVTTIVLVHLLLRAPWRKLFVVLVAIPLSVAKNALRIFIIAMLTTRVDPSYLHGRLHRQGGTVFLLLGIAVILLLIWMLRRGDERDERRALHFAEVEIER